MLALGKINTLRINRFVDFGAYVQSGDSPEILMPGKYLPEDCEVDDEVEAFVYKDSEDRWVATTEKPLAYADEFAVLEVKALSNAGVFLEWGITKDLLMPFREQRERSIVGDQVLVYVTIDPKSERLVATEKLHSFFGKATEDLQGQDVEVLPYQQTELGWKVLVNQRYSGMIFHGEIVEPIKRLEPKKGWVKQVRDDGKLDVVLKRKSQDDLQERILAALSKNDGFLPLHDKTDSEVIRKKLHMSKKQFKEAIGRMFKAKVISISKEGITKL